MKYMTNEKIDGNSILNSLNDDLSDCGSFIIFEGKVRADKVEDSFVEKIIYEAYTEMAEREMSKIEKEAIEKFGVKKVIIKHRVGEVKVKETAFLVVVLSAHRQEGFSAIQYIIDEVKSRVPIWKKEVLSNEKIRWREND